MDHQWTCSTPPVTEKPVWEATALAVERLLVYPARERPTMFLILDRPIGEEVTWDHHQLRMLAVEFRVAYQCEE